MYTGTTFELYGCTTKSFVIDHPDHQDKYLIHGCIEGPESGVYYRNIGEIKNASDGKFDGEIEVYLPEYVLRLCNDNLTVVASPLENYNILTTSLVKNNKFTVYGGNGKFSWIAIGSRQAIQPEMFKKDVIIEGDGPYKYIKTLIK
jgi:hypothetical protein